MKIDDLVKMHTEARRVRLNGPLVFYLPDADLKQICSDYGATVLDQVCGCHVFPTKHEFPMICEVEGHSGIISSGDRLEQIDTRIYFRD